MDTDLATLAGLISTALLALGGLPMLAKAFLRQNLASSSLGNLLLSVLWGWIGSILDLIFWAGLVAGLALAVVWAIQRVGYPTCSSACCASSDCHATANG